MMTSRCEEIVEHDSTALIARASRRHGGLASSSHDSLDAPLNRKQIQGRDPSKAEALPCLQVSLPVHVGPFTGGVQALADKKICQFCQNQRSTMVYIQWTFEWTRLSS